MIKKLTYMPRRSHAEQPALTKLEAKGLRPKGFESIRSPNAILNNPDLRAKVDFENSVRLVTAYFEECIQHRDDSSSFDDEKRQQDPEFFAHLYKDDPDKITRDLNTIARIKKGMERASFFARVAEMILWQAQKDYALFCVDASVTPTSEFDDLTKGVDLVLEVNSGIKPVHPADCFVCRCGMIKI